MRPRGTILTPFGREVIALLYVACDRPAVASLIFELLAAYRKH